VTVPVSRNWLLDSIAMGAITCWAVAALLTLSCAAAVRLTGTSDEIRDSLRLSFAGVVRTPGEALGIALQNGRIAAATVLCALTVSRLPRRGRFVVDAGLAAVLAFNALIVGLALGAYGERLVVATAAHLPIEFAAFSVAGGAYLSARRRPLPSHSLAYAGGLSSVLLVVAAIAETYVSGGRS
jgi:hypothetical protein